MCRTWQCATEVWSRLQSVSVLVKRSSSAASACAGELLGLAELFKELHYKVSVCLEMDSDSARHILQRSGPGGLKHIEIRCMSIQQWIRENSLSVSRVDTKNNTADLFTKHVDGLRTRALAKKLVLRFLNEAGGTNVGAADGGTNEEDRWWLILNKLNKWFHSSRVKFPFVNMSASWVFGVNVFDLDFEGPNWFDQITNQEQPCGFWKHVSLSGFVLYDHLDHCFVVFKHIQQSFPTRRIDVWGNTINIVQIIDHSLRFLSFFEVCAVLNESHVGSYTSLTVLDYSDTCFLEELRRSDPINQELEFHPCVYLHPKRWFLLL